MTGFFITFEGQDGSGKTGQADLLASALREQGYNVELTREPGGSVVGKYIRDLLKQDWEPFDSLDDYTELFLFMADRSAHVQRVIKPKLEEGTIVISDRYIESTMAYQGYGKQISLGVIHQLNAIACHGIYPDFTVVLDITEEEAIKRITARGAPPDQYDHAALDLRHRIAEGYRKLHHHYQAPNTIRMIFDGNKPVEKIHAAILCEVTEQLALKGMKPCNR